jgi:hypothetical protein
MGIIIKSNTKINSKTTVGNYGATPIVPYSFSVFTNGGICSDTFGATVYSTSAVLGVGSSLFQNIGLTIPTNYNAISNPEDSGNSYFILTGNIITSTGLCG